ncbi:Hypothetical protein R9X50_00576300 [Acrodontium crateriforme]|uniref:Uncharacterized protein n=1 Tax=Acrodontium crateriforme TaxID=150365 RepID=A0AAQ3RBR8_9PEZI|nr:Hypothetical protein R9X50_00576300 [Acrodontium crateriforme]
MNVIDSVGLSDFGAEGEEDSSDTSSALMRPDEQLEEKSAPAILAAHDDARALVRLVQCQLCSKPFRLPVTLPCGHSLCRDCLPEAHEREHVSYPDIPGRRKALQCPFEDCDEEHATADCNVDVTLNKIMEAIVDVVAKHTSIAGDTPTTMEVISSWDNPTGILPSSEKTIYHQLPGGRLIATFTLAAQGKLGYNTELNYPIESSAEESERAVDDTVLSDLLESLRKEVDCHVCYNLMLDPVTTFCGHTLCRRCLERVLDHSLHCPVCRRTLVIQPSLKTQPTNKTLDNLLKGLCAEALAARAEAFAQEEDEEQGDLKTPLFVCTLGFPNQPTFLRIFEPRYRLMLRRAMETNREFGMLMYNRYLEPQGDLGPVHFYHYGTMLHIVQTQTLSDGTSLIETRGLYRFRVKAHGTRDGYSVGSIERIEDVTLEEEERIEAEETSLPPVEMGDMVDEIARMSTHNLLEMGRAFVARMQSRSASWLQQRVLDIHGQPPSDAALFPYWFASVLPISDEEKYKLLSTTTVRARLKVTASWIRRIESQRWYAPSPSPSVQSE